MNFFEKLPPEILRELPLWLAVFGLLASAWLLLCLFAVWYEIGDELKAVRQHFDRLEGKKRHRVKISAFRSVRHRERRFFPKKAARSKSGKILAKI